MNREEACRKFIIDYLDVITTYSCFIRFEYNKKNNYSKNDWIEGFIIISGTYLDSDDIKFLSKYPHFLDLKSGEWQINKRIDLT